MYLFFPCHDLLSCPICPSAPHLEIFSPGYPNESFQATGDRLSLFQFREKDRLMDQATLLGVRETPLITKSTTGDPKSNIV